jgi:hypothetical protein
MTTIPKLVLLDVRVELLIKELQNELVGDRRHRQEFQVSIGILNEVVRVEREVFFLAPIALSGEKPGDLPREFGLVRSPSRFSLFFLQIGCHAYTF